MGKSFGINGTTTVCYRKPAKKITPDQKKEGLRVDFSNKMKEFHLINSIVFFYEASFWLHANDCCSWFHKDANHELSVDPHRESTCMGGYVCKRQG